jgi:beta-galactosidase/beta-glucuronidase
MRLNTEYVIGEIPHSEHPMPQCMRKNWQCLNGKWELKKENEVGETLFEGEILVPFSPETLNSGLKEEFVLHSGERLVYKRGFPLFREMLQGVTRLHFGAVDSECDVYVNRELVGRHKGGFTAFTVDISSVAREGFNELVVYVRDEGTRNGDARGKQSDNRGGIWYTPQSGIWQTVWVESMPKTHISDLRIYPDAIAKEVRVRSSSGGEEQFIIVSDGDKEIFRSVYLDEITFSYDFELWSPENPKLYDFILTNEAGDEVRSYFAVRSFGRTRDERGIARLTLNEKPYFFNGVLDQGYWSDGMLTYPSDKAAEDELRLLKEMGFNTVRKHIKLEPMRWYYHCDRLGLIVWQDFVNGGGAYKFTHIAAFPFLGFHHRDDDYEYFARENEGGRYEFKHMAEEILTQLYNCPCIGVWVPFNEGWGQFDSYEMTERVRKKDPTRLIDSVSGWHDQGIGKTEIRSLHTYYTPLKVPRDERPVVLSEFGGYSMKTAGHVYDESREFGYKKFKTQDELVKALRILYLQKLKPLIKEGLCGAIYTQVSDVEEEINGFVTYDRKVIKVPVCDMRKINEELLSEPIE